MKVNRLPTLIVWFREDIELPYVEKRGENAILIAADTVRIIVEKGAGYGDRVKVFIEQMTSKVSGVLLSSVYNFKALLPKEKITYTSNHDRSMLIKAENA